MVIVGRSATLALLAFLAGVAGAEAGRLLARRRSVLHTGALSALAAFAGFGLGLWAVPLSPVVWWTGVWQPRAGWARAAVLGVLLASGPASLGAILAADDWLAWLAVLAVATFGGESAAWLVGVRWGRRRLSPSLSPKKTWEGAIAQAVFGLACGLAATLRLPIGEAMLLGLAGGVAAQIGDLAESWCKRKAGVKDSGTILGPQGGFFDLIDGFLGAALAVALISPLVAGS